MVLVHQGENCSPDFAGLGLAGFDKFPEMYALVSVDADHADKVRLVVHGGEWWLVECVKRSMCHGGGQVLRFMSNNIAVGQIEVD